jgi:2-keto-3-deoxy-6-phosphogluconate aldolase
MARELAHLTRQLRGIQRRQEDAQRLKAQQQGAAQQTGSSAVVPPATLAATSEDASVLDNMNALDAATVAAAAKASCDTGARAPALLPSRMEGTIRALDELLGPQPSTPHAAGK